MFSLSSSVEKSLNILRQKVPSYDSIESPGGPSIWKFWINSMIVIPLKIIDIMLSEPVPAFQIPCCILLPVLPPCCR